MKFLLFLLLASPLYGQTIEGYPKVAMEDSARFILMHDWDSTLSNPYATERGYCAHVLVLRHKVTGQLLYLVDRVRRVAMTDSTQYSGTFKNCGPEEINLHTHLPNSCDKEGNCSPGGYDSYDCEPSTTDYKTLFKFGAAFAGVQCDRFAIRFYYNPYNKLNARPKG